MSAPYVVSKVLSDPRLRHAFFGRQGGRSKGDLEGNNMSIAQGDNPDLVVSNRSSAAFALGHPLKNLVVFRQVHSSRVVTLTERPDPAAPIEADAMVTNRPDLLLGIMTADCAPVLLAEPEAGIVAAVHAGWKGAAGGILENTIAAMSDLGADPARIRAAIGPAISASNYEIGPDTAREIAALAPLAADHIRIPDGQSREHFDIPGLLQHQLLTLGVGLVGDLGLCTYALSDAYFSHRRATHEGVNTGRQIALIGLV